MQTRAAPRKLPAVGKLLQGNAFRGPIREFGRGLVAALLRERLGALREQARAGKLEARALARATTATALAAEVRRAAGLLLAPAPHAVINASGVVVHTNLGRSPLSERAAARVAEAATRYMDLEYDLDRGRRGSRLAHLEPLMARVFPGHGFVAVNNNAAAIMLTLRALARGREVIVSRGELVEIGGSFRIPDILAASGARLVEVDTTNRTRIADYAAAITRRTALLLKVHTSNFRIVGFTEDTSVAELSGLAREHGLPLVVDWGSGDLVDLRPLEIHDERPVQQILEDGAGLVTFSGDKLLGGPQAGFAVGDPGLIARLRRDPLARIVRLDRLLIAALHETLAAYVRGSELEEVPTLRMLAAPAREIGSRAERVLRAVRRAAGTRRTMRVVDGISRSGGGSSPVGERPTRLLAVDGRDGDELRLERELRRGSPPVVARLHEGRLLLDLRTVFPEQEPALIERLAAVLSD